MGIMLGDDSPAMPGAGPSRQVLRRETNPLIRSRPLVNRLFSLFLVRVWHIVCTDLPRVESFLLLITNYYILSY